MMNAEQRKKALAAKIEDARAEMYAIEDQENAVKRSALDGKCFKYRNCYSCPADDADYWWLYVRVKLSGDKLVGLAFQRDRYGKCSVEQEPRMPQHFEGAGYVQITYLEYAEAWNEFSSKVAEMAGGFVAP
jgi:hypothetical protein